MGEIDAFILAAGLGTRLRPLTLRIPKPLLPVQGIPILDIQLARLLRVPGVRRIVVNAHHLADKMRAHLAAHPAADRILLSHEPEILGTGGGIAQAAPLLASDPFLVVNSDPPFAHPIGEAVRFHEAGRFLASIVLLRNGPLPCVLVDEDRVVSFRGGIGRSEALTFTGMHVISRAFLDRLPRAGFHDVGLTYEDLAGEGRLGAFILEQAPDCAFLDVGSPDAYLELHRLWAEGRMQGLGIEGIAGERAAADAEGHAAAGYGWVDAAAVVGAGARIARSVVLEGARIGAGVRVEDAILGPGAAVTEDVIGRLVTVDGEAALGIRA